MNNQEFKHLKSLAYRQGLQKLMLSNELQRFGTNHPQKLTPLSRQGFVRTTFQNAQIAGTLTAAAFFFPLFGYKRQGGWQSRNGTKPFLDRLRTVGQAPALTRFSGKQT